MTPLYALLIGVCAVVVAAFLVTAALRRVHPADYAFIPVPGDEEAYVVNCPAGHAVVRKVFSDRGWSYEIETHFRHERVRSFLVAPTRVAAENALRQRSDEHQTEKGNT